MNNKKIAERFFSLYRNDTPKELAKRLGVSDVTVYEWRTGKKKLSMVRLEEAVKSFGVSWDWLLTGSEGAPARNPRPEAPTDKGRLLEVRESLLEQVKVIDEILGR